MTDRTIDIDTPRGRVRGLRRASGSCAFLGIPFALPPIGELRFGAPVPHPGWAGVLDATTYGATPQRKPISQVTLIPEPSIPGESTLNVNVFTPEAREGALPVLVWIHGGGFVAGSPASPFYDGAAFNRDGVVTVTISYRLGFDGFGWIDGAPANRGVLDWLGALEWVRDNIAAFGGDPAKVTIAGQSAGGAAVLTLLGLPQAQSLFRSAACLSGPLVHIGAEAAEKFGHALAARLDVPPTRAGLSTVDESLVLAAERELAPVGDEPVDPVEAFRSLVSGLRLGPTVDGELIAESTTDSIRSGCGRDKPLVLGSTEHEFTFAFTRARAALADLAPAPLLASAGVPDEEAAAYLAAHPDLDTADLLGGFITDRMFGSAVTELATARGDAPTWAYRFTWPSPVIGQAVHCLDVPFFFDCLDAPGAHAIAGDQPPHDLARQVHGAAADLITNGDPGWSRWSAKGDRLRRF